MSSAIVRQEAHTSRSGVIKTFRKIEPSTGKVRKDSLLSVGLNVRQLNKEGEIYARR